MKKILTALVTLSICSTVAMAQPKSKDVIENNTNLEETQDDWIFLGKHQDSEYQLQKNSMKILSFEAGKALRMTMQTTSDKGLFYNNLFFWVNSCKQKQGELVYFTLDQKNSKASMVVVGGKDIGSKAVTYMCQDYEYYQKHLSTLTEQEIKESNEWQDIAITDKLITSYKKETVQLIPVKGKPGIQFSGRVIDLTSKKVSLQEWSSNIQDCKNGNGVLHIKDVSTNSFSFNNFSFHSGSMASLIAEDLCKKIPGNEDIKNLNPSKK